MGLEGEKRGEQGFRVQGQEFDSVRVKGVKERGGRAVRASGGQGFKDGGQEHHFFQVSEMIGWEKGARGWARGRRASGFRCGGKNIIFTNSS